MPTDPTSICNTALSHVGGEAIMALTDETASARLCRLHYEQSRDELLQSHQWNFSIKQAQLSRLAEAPHAWWEYQFQLPTDCIRVVELGERGDRFEIAEDKLQTDSATAVIRYIARITDATKFPPLFVEALALQLGSKLAKPIASSSTLSTDLLTKLEKVTLPKARQADVVEGRAKVYKAGRRSSFLRSRFW